MSGDGRLAPAPSTRRPIFVMACGWLSLWVAMPAAARASGPGESPFEREVRPLLIGRCLDCHSGDKPAGGLDLSTREGMLAGGSASGPVVEPGDASASMLLDLVADGTMPPEEADRLDPEQVEVLRAWIDRGAAWTGGALEVGSVTTDRRAGLDWWSLQPVRRPGVPAPSRPDRVRNPIDAFILGRLDAEGLEPAPEADRRTPIRRMTFDLHGLPPTPEEVDAFLADSAPDAVERLVDRLLASPRYGERWARHWLDVVRFAESHGYEHDSPRPHAWPYRDSVVPRTIRRSPTSQARVAHLFRCR